MTAPAAIRRRLDLVDTPVLRGLRERREVWSGPVYWDLGEVDGEALERELRVVRGLGFQVVRFHELQPTYLGGGRWDASRRDAWFAAAERAGIGVVLVAEVFHRPPELLLREHGIAPPEFARSWFDDPRHVAVIDAYQRAFLGPLVGRCVAWCLLGEPHGTTIDLADPVERDGFAAWLRGRHGTLPRLNDAWRVYRGETVARSWEEAAFLGDFRTAGTINGVGHAGRRYGAERDFARYKADRELARARVLVARASALDPTIPIGVGSHQLFVNQAKLGWDIGAWARTGHLHTTSIHLSWHFDPVAGEVDLPVWLQARMTRDAQKSGFTSAFETTGGAVQCSGGYGNHMDAGLMRRLCLSYLAAGNPAMAFWTWNARPGGWEQGEYGMTGLSGKPMPWAHEAGRIARAMEAHRDELWSEPHHAEVGVVESWDTDAILACEPERHDASEGVVGTIHAGVAGLHRRALIGVGRALTLAHVGFEYVTLDELRAGLGGCYRTLVCPWHRALAPDLFPVLETFVAAGGRLVVDAQFAFCDHAGRITPRGEGTALARLLGGWVEVVHDARTGGPAWHGQPVRGFWADVSVATAEVIGRFDDGRPALLRHRIGHGEAILCATDPSLAAWKPGNAAAEGLLAELCRVEPPAWTSSLSLTYRRDCGAAHHYFLVNPGPATTARITSSIPYAGTEDVLDGGIGPGGTAFAVPIPAASATWIRARLAP